MGLNGKKPLGFFGVWATAWVSTIQLYFGLNGYCDMSARFSRYSISGSSQTAIRRASFKIFRISNVAGASHLTALCALVHSFHEIKAGWSSI